MWHPSLHYFDYQDHHNDDRHHHCDDIYKCNAPTGDAGAQKFDLHCCIVFMVTVMMVMIIIIIIIIIIIMCGCLTLSAGAPECDSRRCIAWLFTSPFVYSHLHFVRVEVRININADVDVDVDVCVDVDVADSDGVDVMICRLTAGHCWLELCWQLENWFCHHASPLFSIISIIIAIIITTNITLFIKRLHSRESKWPKMTNGICDKLVTSYKSMSKNKLQKCEFFLRRKINYFFCDFPPLPHAEKFLAAKEAILKIIWWASFQEELLKKSIEINKSYGK